MPRSMTESASRPRRQCLAIATRHLLSIRPGGFAALALFAILASGCASLPFFGQSEDHAARESTEQQLYELAQSNLRSSNYSQAIERLQLLESRFPFGRYAEQAQLEIIYAYYMSFQPEAARSAADRFIRLHPEHANVDYAYYVSGLAAFNRDIGFLDRLFNLDASKRDVSAAREAFVDFSQLVTRFPDSPYAPDARQRMIFLRNLLASAEINVAEFYLRRQAYIAAANRARYVVENYPQTPVVGDALAMMIECYQRLEMHEAANDTLRVLALNFPDHPSLRPDGTFEVVDPIRNADRSWINMVTFGLLDRPQAPPPIRVVHPGDDGDAAPRATPGEAPGQDKRPWFRRILG